MKKTGFCVRCRQERPITKIRLTPRMRAGKIVGVKTWVCAVCREKVEPPRSKYNAVPTMGTTGRMRHSSSEAAYESMLQWQAKLGEIEGLRLCNDPPKETYYLDVYGTPEVDALLDWVSQTDSDLVQALVRRVRQSREHITTYTPDFSYKPKGRERRSVVDTKGYASETFSMKRNLMRACHGIDLEVVKVPRSVLEKFGKRSA